MSPYALNRVVVCLILLLVNRGSVEAGPFLNVSYNGPVTATDVRVGFIVNQSTTLVFSVESVAGPGGAGIPDPTLELIDVSDGSSIIFNEDCDVDVEMYLGRSLATPRDACAIIVLDPGAYAVLARDSAGVSGNVLVSVIESLVDIAFIGGQVTLAWDASSSIEVGGYRLYYGQASQHYTSIIDVGNQTFRTVAGLTLAETYYFAVTAYDSKYTMESGFSNEVNTFVRALF